MKKIGKIARSGRLVQLSEIAARHSELHRAILASLPDWIDADGIDFELLPRSVLRLHVSHAKACQLRQILPTLKENLRRQGVRSVRIWDMRKGAPPLA